MIKDQILHVILEVAPEKSLLEKTVFHVEECSNI